MSATGGERTLRAGSAVTLAVWGAPRGAAAVDSAVGQCGCGMCRIKYKYLAAPPVITQSHTITFPTNVEVQLTKSALPQQYSAYDLMLVPIQFPGLPHGVAG